MKNPISTWLRVCRLLLVCFPLASVAKAPPPTMKPVPITSQERASIKDFSPLGECAQPSVDPKQSFRLQQKGAPLDGALLISMMCQDNSGVVAFGFYRNGKLEQALPAHRANTWSVEESQAIAFPDVNGDGRFELLTIVSAMTGMGPTGAEPFNVAAVWFQSADGKWAADPRADKALEQVRQPDVKKAVAALKKAYAKK
ncbi:MAG TPA: hypothetical protein VEU33_36155 [Archangium sp.]|nr:hypothetical protein [Archangium sp.]